jgi:hypothetical protein
MGIARGTNIVRDGLVFGYDSGYGIADNITSTRFYKGAPTTNPIYNQNAVAQDSYTTYSATSSGTWNAKHPNAIRAYNSQGGDITGYYNGGVGDAANTYHAIWELDPILNKPVVVMNDVAGQWKAKSFGTGLGSWTSQGKTHGDTYTISWLQWVNNLSKNAKAGLYTKNSSGSSGFHDGQANSASAYNTKLGTWQRVYQTYTTNSNRNLDDSMASIYMYGHYNVRAIVKVADVQWQWGSTPYPFVEGDVSERSSTQSLIDLKRTTSIDVSNVSFDSTGQPEFDGTDDKIPTGISTAFTDFSCVVVFKHSVNTAWGRIVDKNYTNGFFMSSYFLSGGSGYVGAGIIEPSAPHGQSLQYDNTKYNYFVVTRSGTTHTIYLNGSSNYASKTGSGAALNSAEIHVGAWYTNSTTQRFTGSIPVVKIYDRALTAAEIEQDFKAYKNRFNI